LTVLGPQCREIFRDEEAKYEFMKTEPDNQLRSDVTELGKDMKNTESTTQRYIAENEYVMALPRVRQPGQAKRFYQDSVLSLLSRKLLSLRSLKGYLIEIITGWRWLIGMWRLRNSQYLYEAMVIGNGPSQGYLDTTMLVEFKKKGGQLFAVNFWTENEFLSEIIPDYIVVSDPETLSVGAEEHLIDKNNRLSAYLRANTSIKIACPLRRCSELSKIFGEQRVIGFADSSLRMWTKNINPLLPRGYLSMTLYKALALAIWFDYKKIFVIGMDNTYPRNIYCNRDNKFINHEMHAGGADYAVDQSAMFNTVGDSLIEFSQLFFDARKFTRENVINLDQYSLTDAFNKMTIHDWSDEINNRSA
jgi:hypothetical protein